MNEKALFSITEEDLDSGLRGFPIGHCTTSYVDPQEGLFYVGTPIAKLAQGEPIEVIYLLHHGRRGSPGELASFSALLAEQSALAPHTVQAIQRLPRGGNAMQQLAAALLLLGIAEGERGYREDGLNLIAKLPHLVALVINGHAGWGATPPPCPERGYIESFLSMVRCPDPPSAMLLKILKCFHILHQDHGGGNLSAFVGKAVASGLENMYGSIAASMCALAGPRHGRANQESFAFVQAMIDRLGEQATADEVQQLLEERLRHNNRIPGFGHAVLRVEDPRASLLYAMAEEHFGDHPLIRMALLIRQEGHRLLAHYKKVADPYPNIDAISGVLLAAAGFPYPAYYAPLFGFARMVGIVAQIIYERLEAHGGKGTPIVRPRYLYSPPLTTTAEAV